MVLSHRSWIWTPNVSSPKLHILVENSCEIMVSTELFSFLMLQRTNLFFFFMTSGPFAAFLQSLSSIKSVSTRKHLFRAESVMHHFWTHRAIFRAFEVCLKMNRNVRCFQLLKSSQGRKKVVNAAGPGLVFHYGGATTNLHCRLPLTLLVLLFSCSRSKPSFILYIYNTSTFESKLG